MPGVTDLSSGALCALYLSSTEKCIWLVFDHRTGWKMEGGWARENVRFSKVFSHSFLSCYVCENIVWILRKTELCCLEKIFFFSFHNMDQGSANVSGPRCLSFRAVILTSLGADLAILFPLPPELMGSPTSWHSFLLGPQQCCFSHQFCCFSCAWQQLC